MASAVTCPQASLSARFAVRGTRAQRRTAVSCKRVNTTTRAAIVDPPKVSIKDVQRPDETGRFGDYGGKYVPETLIPALQALEKEYAALASDEAFQVRTNCRFCEGL
jgi:tryptophan synthase beta chain|tara:strand:+ start:4569 stop:4889 length:321 start_codon:yes stop_codon:yes gene_type:complete